MLRCLGVVDAAGGREGLRQRPGGNARFSLRLPAGAASGGERPGTTRPFAKEIDHDHAWNNASKTWRPRLYGRGRRPSCCRFGRRGHNKHVKHGRSELQGPDGHNWDLIPKRLQQPAQNLDKAKADLDATARDLERVKSQLDEMRDEFAEKAAK